MSLIVITQHCSKTHTHTWFKERESVLHRLVQDFKGQVLQAGDAGVVRYDLFRVQVDSGGKRVKGHHRGHFHGHL